jgi:phosphatidylserine decarboxylase
MTRVFARREAARGKRGTMVREGYSFGLPPFLLGVALLAWGRGWAFAAGLGLALLGLFVFGFFRNPDRVIPSESGVIVAPADGRVVVVKEEDYSGRAGKRVSIFLAVWNVHVNRAPAAGMITKLQYQPGKFLAAWDERTSLENEQNVFTQATEHGEIVYKQIAGWVARRCISWKKAGDIVARGERIGLVRFGSRMDVWLPSEAQIAVQVGQNVKGGSSVLARMPEIAKVRRAGIADGSFSMNQKTQEHPSP